MTTSKLQRAGEQRRRGEGAGWIMRIVKHHQPGLVSDFPGKIVKIRQEMVLRPERQAIKRRPTAAPPSGKSDSRDRWR